VVEHLDLPLLEGDHLRLGTRLPDALPRNSELDLLHSLVRGEERNGLAGELSSHGWNFLEEDRLNGSYRASLPTGGEP